MDRIIIGLMAFMTWSVSMDLASSSIVNAPVDREVMVGHSTYLNCSTSDQSTGIHWYRYPVGAGTKDHEYVYAHGRMHPSFGNRFRIEKDNSPGSFDLVLTDVEFRDAGLYVCQNAGGTGQPFTAQLVVLDALPSCETNIKPEGFIGPNSCGLQPDKVQLSCGVNYHGNIPPVLEWTWVGQESRESSSEPLCEVSGTRITCNATLDTDIGLDGSSFVCQTIRAAQEQYRCTTDEAKVLYAVSGKEPLEKTIGDDVACSAKTNSPSCTYKWIRFDGVTENVTSNDVNLKITEHGWHRCEALCEIKENLCKIVPMLVKTASVDPINNSTKDVVIVVLATFILCLIIAAIPTGYFMWRKLNEKTPELRGSFEELRVKDCQREEEQKAIQALLRQIEELAAQMLKALEKAQNQKDRKNRTKLRLEELNAMLIEILRGILVYREESLRSKYGFKSSTGSISNEKKMKDKETPALKIDEESMMPLNYDEYNETGGEDRTSDDYLVLDKSNETGGEDRTSDDYLVLDKSNEIGGEDRTSDDYLVLDKSHEIRGEDRTSDDLC